MQPPFDLPVVKIQNAWRLGSCAKPKRRSQGSEEGLGMSITTHPAHWAKYLGYHEHGLWLLAPKPPRPVGVFLSVVDLTQRQAKKLSRRAVDEGLLEPGIMWEARWREKGLGYEEEDLLSDEDDYDAVRFYTRQEAADFVAAVVAEGGGDEDEGWEEGSASVVKIKLLAPTDALLSVWRKHFTRDPIGQKAEEAAWQVMLERDWPELDGFWWDDALDAGKISAPRGSIFYSRIDRWSWKKTTYAQAENAMRTDDGILDNPPRQRFLVRSVKQGLDLIRHPAIEKNFEKALRWRPKNELAVLVPCAGTKPFPEAPSHKQGYLAALEDKDADLWVVSEPLGVVPYAWSETWPNDAYDFPPKFLRGEAWDALVERVAEWLEKVAPKYKNVFVALPGHHERLLRAALELHNPGNLRDATHSQCLGSGACPPGHGRATSTKYRRYLSAVVKNPDDRLRKLEREAQAGDVDASRRLAHEWVRSGMVGLGSIVTQRSTGRAFRADVIGLLMDGRDVVVGVEPLEPTQDEIDSVRNLPSTVAPGAFIGRLGFHGRDQSLSFVPRQKDVVRNPDEDLRALERRATAGGGADDRERLAHARTRAGQAAWDDRWWTMDAEELARIGEQRVRELEDQARRLSLGGGSAADAEIMRAVTGRGVLSPEWRDRLADVTKRKREIYADARAYAMEQDARDAERRSRMAWNRSRS